MEPSKVYAMPKAYWLVPVAITGLFIYFLLTPTNWFERGLMLLAVGINWWMFLTLPQRVELTWDGYAQFDGVLIHHRFNLADITTIENHNRQLIIRHTQGKITIPNFIHNLPDLAAEFQRRNPAIVLEDSALVKFGRSPKRVLLLAVGISLLVGLITALALIFLR